MGAFRFRQYHDLVKFFPPQKWGDFLQDLGMVAVYKFCAKIKKPEGYSGFRTKYTKMLGLSQSVYRFYKIFILLNCSICHNRKQNCNCR